jgi:hypothetical protein
MWHLKYKENARGKNNYEFEHKRLMMKELGWEFLYLRWRGI